MLISGATPKPSRLDELLDVRLLARLDRLDLRSRKLFPGKLLGERRSKKRGQSVEFEDFRPYVPGDDLRFVDWNVYARLDRLILKIFLEEEDLALHIALDASASMDAGGGTTADGTTPAPSKLMMASRLSLALCSIGLVNHNRVGLTVFGAPGMRSIARLPDVRGRHHLPRLGQFLMDAAWTGREGSTIGDGAPGAGADFNSALTTIARMRVGKGVMIVLSDFLAPEGYESGLKALAAAGGYDTYCLQVLSPWEVEPERAAESLGGPGSLAGDLRLTDVETGRGAEVTISAALLKKYKERLERYCADLHSFCAAREMAHMLVRSDAELETLVMDTFRRTGMLS